MNIYIYIYIHINSTHVYNVSLIGIRVPDMVEYLEHVRTPGTCHLARALGACCFVLEEQALCARWHGAFAHASVQEPKNMFQVFEHDLGVGICPGFISGLRINKRKFIYR